MGAKVVEDNHCGFLQNVIKCKQLNLLPTRHHFEEDPGDDTNALSRYKGPTEPVRPRLFPRLPVTRFPGRAFLQRHIFRRRPLDTNFFVPTGATCYLFPRFQPVKCPTSLSAGFSRVFKPLRIFPRLRSPPSMFSRVPCFHGKRARSFFE